MLGVSAPWKVTSVTLDIPAKQLIVNIELEPGIKWIHPETKQPANIHKWTERTWRDLDSVSFATIIKAKVPSIKYADGKIEEVAVSWAERYQRYTRQFEQQVIMWLKACGNVSKVAECLNLHWQTVDRIMKRAVERGLMKRDHQIIRHIGIDEKSFRKGHVYASVMNDLENNRVWDLVEGRKQKSSDKLFETLSKKQRDAVEAVVMDMWIAFENSALKKTPNADIVYDKFHVSAHLNKAVDNVRKNENRKLLSEGDSTLSKTKYKWLRSYEDLREDRSFQELYNSNLNTSRAWRFKEAFRHFWGYRYKNAAERFFEEWYNGVLESKIEPLIKVANMLAKRFSGILNYLKHGITNAGSEGMNSLIARISANARGLRSFETLRTRVLFFLGKLDLSI